MAQQEKVLPTKLNDLSSINLTHTVEGEKWSPKLLSDYHALAMGQTHTCTHVHKNKWIKIKSLKLSF